MKGEAGGQSQVCSTARPETDVLGGGERQLDCDDWGVRCIDGSLRSTVGECSSADDRQDSWFHSRTGNRQRGHAWAELVCHGHQADDWRSARRRGC